MAISSRIDQKPVSPNVRGDQTQLSLPTDVCKINSQASRYCDGCYAETFYIPV